MNAAPMGSALTQPIPVLSHSGASLEQKMPTLCPSLLSASVSLFRARRVKCHVAAAACGHVHMTSGEGAGDGVTKKHIKVKLVV